MITLTQSQIDAIQAKIDNDNISGAYADLIAFGDKYAVLAKSVTVTRPL